MRIPSLSLPGAILVPRSENGKTGRITATYVSQETCPCGCPFRNNGCYAETGFPRFATSRVAKSGQGLSASAIIRNEASLIQHYAKSIASGFYANRIISDRLRLHIVGDVVDGHSARRLNSAIREWAKALAARGVRRPKAWLYTRNWRNISRGLFNGCLNPLASVLTAAEAREASKRGYLPALVVTKFPNGARAAALKHDPDLTIIPCPAQTKSGVTCDSCGLCMRGPEELRPGAVIGFESHGSGKARVDAVLIQLSGRLSGG